MAEEPKTLDPERLVAVRTFLNRIDADLAQGALEAAGITAMVGADDADGNQPGLWMGGVRLLVREEDAEEAAQVLGARQLTAGNRFTGEPLQGYHYRFAQVPIMYAIIQAGGRQMRVTPGGFATIDGTAGEPGAELTLDQVLLVEKDGGEVLAGAPFVANARVVAVVEGETRGPKIRVFKKKRRKGMRRTKGHRAVYTRVAIKEILL